jgi:hypothetical protein
MRAVQCIHRASKQKKIDGESKSNDLVLQGQNKVIALPLCINLLPLGCSLDALYCVHASNLTHGPPSSQRQHPFSLFINKDAFPAVG